jgi:HK97 family phage prohead protease
MDRPSGREHRRLSFDNIEVRADSAGEAIEVRGHAAVWDKPAWIGPPKYGFSERFAKGAFAKTIADGADVRYLFNHNPDDVLARTKSGTLRLSEDRTGLDVSAELAPTNRGRDLSILFARGDVDQMSVGMQVLRDQWEEVEGADGQVYERRTILEAKLFDVSAVTYPAYEETDAGLRDADLARESRDARGQHVTRIRQASYTVDEIREKEAGEPATATPEPPAAPLPERGERPEDPAPDPATATPMEPAESDTEERSLPLHELLLRHASGKHAGSPRALCPACVKPEPATATPAA